MEPDALLERLRAFEGRRMAEPTLARDPVNPAMIRHWCDAIGDRNPVYTDPLFAAGSRHGGPVAPPTMLQAWTMPGLRPLDERAAAPHRALFGLLDVAGFTSIVATNCTQEYARYLVPGDRLEVETRLESVSEEKRTALGSGHFLTQRMRYRDQTGAEVASMRFRMLKFRPKEAPQPAARSKKTARRPLPARTPDNGFFWEGIEAGELRIQRCTGCGSLRHPPGPMCPRCRCLDWDFVCAEGGGEVYSYAVAHHPPIPPFAYPNAVAVVALDEGTRVVANLVGIDPARIEVGLRVRAHFEELEPGRRFLQFRPEGQGDRPPAPPPQPEPAVADRASPAAEPAAPPRLKTLRPDELSAGEALPGLDVPLTRTRIVAGAIASRDYQEVHHDPELARSRGSRDIFMNILTTNGFVGRFVTDWAGPDARLLRVDIRLGAPNYPGDTMRLSGRVEGVEGPRVAVSVVGRNGLGDHVRGRVDLELPGR